MLFFGHIVYAFCIKIKNKKKVLSFITVLEMDM